MYQSTTEVGTVQGFALRNPVRADVPSVSSGSASLYSLPIATIRSYSCYTS